MIITHDSKIGLSTEIVDTNGVAYSFIKSYNTETKIGIVYVTLKGENNRIAFEEDGKTPATHTIKFPDSTKAINRETRIEIK